MKALHFVKRSDSSRWACEMVEQLVANGIEVSVVLPSENGSMMDYWRKTGAKLIFAYTELPVKKMWNFFKVKRDVERIIREEKPDVIHTHFFSQAMLLRLIKIDIPRIFQVPGPLHLENIIFRKWDLWSAKKNDFWIASSKYVYNIYISAKVSEKRLGLSYYGNHLDSYSRNTDSFRGEFDIPKDEFVIGNLSYFYPPKWYLNQRVGLKGHELLVKILNKMKIRSIIFGGQLGERQDYFYKIKDSAHTNISFSGDINPFEVSKAWSSMDVCLHLPLSENCGGVLEPLLHGVPVICCYTGGLEEVVINGKTGVIINRSEGDAVKAIEWAMQNSKTMQSYAQNGQKLILTMFDVKRTSLEIIDYYHNLKNFSMVAQFDSKEFNYD